MTGRYINTDSTDHKQKSAYEMYAERMTVEKMDREFKRKCQNTQVRYKNNFKRALVFNKRSLYNLLRKVDRN